VESASELAFALSIMALIACLNLLVGCKNLRSLLDQKCDFGED